MNQCKKVSEAQASAKQNGVHGRHRILILMLVACAIATLLPAGSVASADLGISGNGSMTATQVQQAPAIIITDLARYSDDAVALMMLLRSGVLDIKGVITTAGNVCAGEAASETRRLLATLGRETVPVMPGRSMAWHEERRRYYRDIEMSSAWPPGYAGAFGAEVRCEVEAQRDLTEAPDIAVIGAAEFLIDTAKKSEGRLVVVLQGPATVLALALAKEPRLPELLGHVYAMGGNLRVPGNTTAYAEFNVWFDPEAMSALLKAGIALTLVPLDATRTVTYAPFGLDQLQKQDPAARYLSDYLEFRQAGGRREVAMWDEVLAAIVIDRSIVIRYTEQTLAVSIARDEEFGRLIELPMEAQFRPATIVLEVNGQKINKLISDLLLGK